MIPSPNVAENHQYYNALTRSSRGAAVLEEEKDMDPEATASRIIDLVCDREKISRMSSAAREIAAPNAAALIYSQIKTLLKG